MLRKDTDESDADVFFKPIQTREQKALSKKTGESQKRDTNDYNVMAQKLLRDSQEKCQNSPPLIPEETIEDVESYLKSTGAENTDESTEDPHFYAQFLSEEQPKKNNATVFEPQSSNSLELDAFEGEEAGTDTKPEKLVTESSQIISVSCSSCAQNANELEDIRSTQILIGQRLDEIKALVVALKIDGFNSQRVLQSIKEDTSATLVHFDPTENPLTSMAPGFDLPIMEDNVLKQLEEKLRTDSVFHSVMVSVLYSKKKRKT